MPRRATKMRVSVDDPVIRRLVLLYGELDERLRKVEPPAEPPPGWRPLFQECVSRGIKYELLRRKCVRRTVTSELIAGHWWLPPLCET